VNAVLFAPDDQLVTISSDGTARVWDLIDGVQTAAYHHGGFLKVAGLDPAGRRLVTGSWSRTAKIWNLRRQSRIQTYASPVAGPGEDGAGIVQSVVKAGRLARIGKRGIAVWDLVSAGQWTWSAPDLVDGALSPDGRTAIAADQRGILHVLDASGNVRHPFRDPIPGVACVALFPDGRRVATCGPPGMVAIWDVTTGQQLARYPTGTVNAIILSRDGDAMFAFDYADTANTAGWLLAGDLSRGVQLHHNAILKDARFSPDGARLVTLSLNGAWIWNRNGEIEAKLDTGPVTAAVWSSDGSWLATGNNAGTLTIWDRPGWRARKPIDAHGIFIRALAIDDRNALIATAGGDGTVKLWDVEQLLQVARIPTGTPASDLAFERDTLLVSGPLATQSWRCDR
jgi:WD40 repeat protein